MTSENRKMTDEEDGAAKRAGAAEEPPEPGKPRMFAEKESSRLLNADRGAAR
jgi:hypothetical protein